MALLRVALIGALISPHRDMASRHKGGAISDGNVQGLPSTEPRDSLAEFRCLLKRPIFGIFNLSERLRRQVLYVRRLLQFEHPL